jgi:hypothetical protein
LNEFFHLPSSFPLGVITGLISSDPGLVIHNFDWILGIDKIGLQLQFLYVNHLFWNTEAFPELRDMENIMNRG